MRYMAEPCYSFFSLSVYIHTCIYVYTYIYIASTYIASICNLNVCNINKYIYIVYIDIHIYIVYIHIYNLNLYYIYVVTFSTYVVSSVLGAKRDRAVRHMVVALKKHIGHERTRNKHK